ncbi:MAG: FAD binding domain-containing protein [Polyangiaceae bacterium]
MSTTDFVRYDMQRVADLGALCALLDERRQRGEEVVLLAGGTDFMVQVSQGERAEGPLPLVVDISRLPELRRVEQDGERLRIGAGVSYLELQRHPAVVARTPAIAAMTYDVGGPTIQARGTLGGNLATASPAADGVAAIAAYDPTILVRSTRGERRIPFAELQTGYKQSTRAADEVIVAIEIDLPRADAAQIWRKVGTRAAQAISKVALAAVAEVGGERVTRFGLALASVAPVTARMATTRELVLGRPLAAIDGASLDAAVERDIAPIDDIRSTAAYRRHVAKALTREVLRGLGAPV